MYRKTLEGGWDDNAISLNYRDCVILIGKSSRVSMISSPSWLPARYKYLAVCCPYCIASPALNRSLHAKLDLTGAAMSCVCDCCCYCCCYHLDLARAGRCGTCYCCHLAHTQRMLQWWWYLGHGWRCLSCKSGWGRPAVPAAAAMPFGVHPFACHSEDEIMLYWWGGIKAAVEPEACEQRGES